MDSLSLALSIIFSVVGVAGSYSLISILRDACVARAVERSPRAGNSNQSAINRTISLLKEAKCEIEMFDDGDSSIGSVYEDADFLDSMTDKLERNPDFRIRCLFNVDNKNLKFTQLFGGHPNVEIFVRIEQPRPSKRHYKTIDGGVKGYISEHDLGDNKRMYEEFSCLNMNRSDASRAGRRILKNIREPIKLFRKVETV